MIAALTRKRRRTHGIWAETAMLASGLHHVLETGIARRNRRGAKRLPPHQIEALVQIQFKIARILSGDPNHADHWDDIAGYAQLARERA